MKKTSLMALSGLILLGAALANLDQNRVQAQEPIKISIFIGLGTGTNAEQLEVEQALVDEWNAAHPDIELSLAMCNHCTAREAIATMIAAGSPPDIVGPMSTFTMWEFMASSPKTVWENLTPYLLRDGVELNLDDFEPQLMSLYQHQGGLYALPFDLFPAVLYVNQELFEEAGLELPPTSYGPNGTAVWMGKPWDMNTLREVAIKLTRDKNGVYADQPGFDPTNIEVYGYADTWSSFREWAMHFSPSHNGILPDLKTAAFEDAAYIKAFQYLHDGIFKDHFMPDWAWQGDLGGTPFESGKVAMWSSHTWYLCCIANANFQWTNAAVPAAPEGRVTATMHANTFAMTADGKNKEAAWKVLKWLYSPEVGPRLAKVYASMPARRSLRAEWEAFIKDRYPYFSHMNPQLIYGTIPYLDQPNHEGWLPEMIRSRDALSVFWQAVQSDPNFEVATELAQLNVNLQILFDEAAAYKEAVHTPAESVVPPYPPMLPKITSVAYLPDGRHFITAREDGTFRLLEAQTGKVIRTFEAHRAGSVVVAVSVDGDEFLSGGADGVVRLWHRQGSTPLTEFKGHSSPITAVALSLDGKMAVSASGGQHVRLWDTSTGDLIKTLRTGGSVTAVAFSPDGKLVLIGTVDGKIQLQDIESNKPIAHFVGHQDTITSAQFSPDGNTALTGSDDDTAILWDVHTGRIVHTLKSHIDEVFDVKFSPDGTLIVTASCDHTVKLWNTQTGELIKTFEGHTEGVLSVAWSPDGKNILTGSIDRTARIWDVSSAATVSTVPTRLGYVEAVAFSPDGKKLLVGNGDSLARLWDVQTGALLKTFEGHTGPIFTVAWSPDLKHIATGGEDGAARVWDVQTGEVVHILQPDYGTSGPIASLAFTSDGKTVVTGSKDFTIRFWNVATGNLIESLYQYGVGVNVMAFSLDGRYVAVGDNTGKVYLRDLQAKTPAVEVTALGNVGSGPYNITGLTFGLNSKSLFVVRSYGTILTWEVESSGVAYWGGSVNNLLSIVPSPDAQTIAMGTTSGAVAIFRGSELGYNHSEGVISLAWSQDGKFIASGSMDGSARIWNAQTRVMLHEVY